MSPAANDPLSTGPADLPEVSQDSQRTVDDPSPQTPSATRFRCPSCHSPIQLADDRSDEVLCPVCGSNFRVQDTRLTAHPIIPIIPMPPIIMPPMPIMPPRMPIIPPPMPIMSGSTNWRRKAKWP
jgi:hypothetical protein